jgi:peptide/nickel transport system permease protein
MSESVRESVAEGESVRQSVAGTEPASEPASAPVARHEPASDAVGPWRAGLRQLRRDPRAIGSVVVLALIVLLCLLAPVYAEHIAHTDPFAANPVGTTIINGRVAPLLQPAARGLGVLPIGPTWDPAHFLLGADANGRDVAARLLYGGQNTLIIGFAAAALSCAGGLVLGLLAGYFRGVVDGVLSRLLDVLWAFPVLLLAISLASISFHSGIDFGLFRVSSASLALPVMIIGAVYVPYTARPIRGAVLSLRESEFVQAAISYGASPFRLVGKEILPNVISRVVVLFPLMVATAMLLESGLSFLGIGVEAPAASWGTIIQDGTMLMRNRPIIVVAAGALLAITVCALNVLGDAVRDALDPRAETRMGR